MADVLADALLERRPMPASFAKIREGYDVTEGGNGTAEAFVCRQTGEVYVRFDFDLTGKVDDELPEDLDDDEKYLPIPDKKELGLAKPLALDFARMCAGQFRGGP